MLLSIVYILTNEAMPGYIKIGRTETSVEQRMRELDKTSVPLPFQCYYARRVANYQKVEAALHQAFGDFRVRQSREFFKFDPYRAKVILELLDGGDVTPSDDVASDDEGRQALEKVARSGRFNLGRYGIPAGAVLEYTSDKSITCKVVDEFTVEFRGQLMNISKAAVMANAERGGKATTAAGPIWWLYNGITLASIRQEQDDRA